jgi:hypothetical protein
MASHFHPAATHVAAGHDDQLKSVGGGSAPRRRRGRAPLIGLALATLAPLLSGCVMIGDALNPAPSPTALACDGQDLTLSEGRATVTLTGRCGDIVVAADRVTLVFDEIDSLTLKGELAAVTGKTITTNIAFAGGGFNEVTWTAGVAAQFSSDEFGNEAHGPS